MPDMLRNRVRGARESRELTQMQLAERMGVSRKTVNTIENGVFIPSTLVALKMARALEARVEDLFWLE